MDDRGERGEKGERGDTGLTGLTGLKGDTGGKGSPCIEDHDLLIRISSKLDSFVELQKDHEDRIRGLERSLIKVLGVGAITGFIAGWLSKFFNN
jgi:hypothetical protein